ncbi:APC family permease [Pajaroellobacter abortibovis]|uniref:Amino acid permease n=1 Tax=Pajaroellobacter abortibovis TaxID=1882918 RepID=A0A1L6MWQ1_9BACT|nr:APC family permease [Pajaroellobacter abortibovis]APR99865.1 hypothetical protein BCY86_03615 [Pajaroellobacter abortibovis]
MSSSASLPQMQRSLGQIALIALGINSIVGVGIFFSPADISSLAPGYHSLFILMATAIALVPAALCFSILGQRFPEDGGTIVFTRHAFGELPAFIVGWLAFMGTLFSVSASLIGFARALAPILEMESSGEQRLVAALLATAITLIAASGTALSARVWTIVTFLKLIPLFLLIAVAGWKLATSDQTDLAPLPPHEVETQWLRAMLITVFTYQGFEFIPVVAGQAKSAEKTIPRAILSSLLLCALLYTALQFTCIRALPTLAQSHAPLAESASLFGGNQLKAMVSVGQSISALGVSLSLFVVGPRYLAALAGNQDVPPLHIGKIASNGVPLHALFITYLFIMLFLSSGTRGGLFTLASLAMVLQHGFAGSALFTLARCSEQGFHRSYQWASYLTLMITLSLLTAVTLKEWMVAVGLLGIGLVLRRFTLREKHRI